MSESCSRTKPWILTLIVRFATLFIVVHFTCPFGHPNFRSARGWLDRTPERLDVVSVGTRSGEQPLPQEPMHLSLGTGLYPIGERRGGAAGGESCLGRRKRDEKNHDPSVQRAQSKTPASEPPHLTNEENRKIQGEADAILYASLRKTAIVKDSKSLYYKLSGRIVHYFISTKRLQNSHNQLTMDLCHQGKKISYDKISDYALFRTEHVVVPSENDTKKRAQRIMQANEYLGSREARGLDLQEKEVELAKCLQNVGCSISSHEWKPLRVYGSIVEVIRSIRTALYRIRQLDELYNPSIYKTITGLKEAQKEAFELLCNFWVNQVFPAIASPERETAINQAKRGSVEELEKSALWEISKRSGRAASDVNALSWIVFEYWFKKNASILTTEIYKGLTIGYKGDMDPHLKYCLSDKAITEALQSRNIKSDYQVLYTARFNMMRTTEVFGGDRGKLEEDESEKMMKGHETRALIS